MVLVHSTPAQQQAAYNVVYPQLVELVNQYVPAFWQWEIQQKLNDQATKDKIMLIIDQALDAAENTT